MWKKMIGKAPISIIVKNEKIVEYANNEAKTILSTKDEEGNGISSSRGINNEFKESSIKYSLTALKKLELEENKMSLYDIVQNSVSSIDFKEKNNFIRKSKKGDLYYEVFWNDKFKFNFKSCLIIFIKEVTSSIKLIKEASCEKYTKIYIASVTHDLRTPINGIMGMMDCISSHTNDPYIQECIKTAKNSSEMLLLLIRDILDLSQLESNSVRLNYESINIIEVVTECSELFSKDFQFKRLESKIQISNNFSGQFCTDKMRYKQILCNLISNALKYTMKGSIKIKLKYEEDNEVLKTTVKDTGVGISQDNQSKLFNLFGKIDSNRSLNPHGIGLGLTICKKFSELLGGNIEVKSQENVGSSFIFRIKNKIIQDFNKKKSSIGPFGNLEGTSSIEGTLSRKFVSRISECDCTKLLLVDDNPTNLCVLIGYLKNKTVKAEVVILRKANNGIEAIEKFEKKSYHTCCKSFLMIFMDINMPMMGGFDAIKIIREKEATLNLEPAIIIACTAEPIFNEEETNNYKECGFDSICTIYIVVKPVYKRSFEDNIKYYLGIAL